MKFQWLTIVLLALWVLAASNSSAEMRQLPISINGRIPLGIETFRLMPANSVFYLMASAENPAFVSMMRVIDGEKDYLISNGKKVGYYPDRVQFRLTASSRERLVDDRPLPTTAPVGLEELFMKLRFRLKVFHALEYRYIQPSYVDDVGMPRDVPYDERIYRIGFNLGRIPIEDRIVMEVLSPSGDRLCKFHLDLM
jgi:hypothetical protein